MHFSSITASLAESSLNVECGAPHGCPGQAHDNSRGCGLVHPVGYEHRVADKVMEVVGGNVQVTTVTASLHQLQGSLTENLGRKVFNQVFIIIMTV